MQFIIKHSEDNHIAQVASTKSFFEDSAQEVGPNIFSLAMREHVSFPTQAYK